MEYICFLFHQYIHISHGGHNRKVEVKYDTADKNAQGYLVAICPSYYKRDALDTLFEAPPKKA